MINFTVVDLGHDGASFSVQDQHGQLHVARTSGLPPTVDGILIGRIPSLGVHLLVDSITSTPISVDFKAVACTQLQALALLHPLSESAPSPQPSEGPAGRSRRWGLAAEGSDVRPV